MTSDSIAPGSIVLVRDEEWLVSSVEPAADGRFINVLGLSELVRDTEATFSTAIDDVVEVDPASADVVPDASPGFRQSRLWLDAMLRKTPVPIAEPQLTVAGAGLATPLDYQYAAVRQALAPTNLRPRILLADAVGLGKTLEIGMILSELIRRGRGDRILVVTPRQVLEQMQMELWTRFAIPLVRLDSVGIQRIRQELPANRNPFAYFKRVIISIDTLKSDRYVAALSKQRWDAVVIDESHNVTNASSQNNRLARLLASRTDALILASATPHNGKLESFAELVRMLDPAAVLPDGSLDEQRLGELVIRRHRHHPDVAREVGSQWAERLPPRNHLVPAGPAENAIAHELEQVWLWPESGTSPYTGAGSRLFPWTLAKAFLSSPAALAETATERRRRIDAASPAGAREAVALDRLLELSAQAAESDSAKYTKLRQLLADAGVGKGRSARVVIFAERVATLRWLVDRLRADLKLDEEVAILHGGLSDQEQTEVIADFKLESSPIRILVTGDVASEGVNLHAQCHHLVHFDIPWSLIRIEQRNGRIDRYGQRERPQIDALLLTPDTERFGGDIRVLTRLIEREHEAHLALGETAPLIGTYDVKAEEDAVRAVLAGEADLDQVVKPVSDVAAGGGLAGLMARLAAASHAAPEAPPQTAQPAPYRGASSTVYPTDIEFLTAAVAEFEITPHLPAPNGIGWAVHAGHSIVELEPPKDLAQRLRTLPQSYLRSRHVTDKFKLAYTAARGLQELEQARAGESTSAWPEAHYLAPLHPVLDWAADRALAQLGRSQIFAAVGNVAEPTVLTQATLTNSRGQVVATMYAKVYFPGPDFALPEVFPDEASAVRTLGLAPANVGALTSADAAWLKRLIPMAVAAVGPMLEGQSDAIRAETDQRIVRWSARTDAWDDAAQLRTQRAELRNQRGRVREEAELAKLMNPDRTLIRPLIVVVPQEEFDPNPFRLAAAQPTGDRS